MKKDLEILKALIVEMNDSYKKSGLKRPEKADLNKDKKISSYEKKRGKAIEKNLKKEDQSNLPQSIEELPKHDGLYHIGGIINYDGNPWVSKADAEKALAMAKAEENPIKEDTSDLSYNAGYGAGARYGYDKGYNDCAAGKKYDQTGISKVRENHEGTDHEVSMANNSLDSILWAANELKKHLGDQERDIPAWIQDHITNAENYIIQAAKNYHEYGAEEAPEDGLGLTNEDLMSTLGGERPYSDSEMRKNIVEPNLGPDYDAYIMFQGPKGQYDQAKQKYVPKDMIGWEPLYRSSSYQGNAYISPDKNVIKAAVLSRGGIVGAIYVKKQNEMSLQEMIKKVGKKYNVYSKKGKKLGSHPSKKKAQKQMAAIEISKQGK